jgi:hypothetical protein
MHHHEKQQRLEFRPLANPMKKLSPTACKFLFVQTNKTISVRCSSATYKQNESSRAAIPYLGTSSGRFRRIFRNCLQTETNSKKKAARGGG